MKTRKCLRCGRQLYSYESQERGYGPKCRTKINKAIAQIKAKPEALDKVRQLILDQAITPFKGRINVYLAASSKDGNKYLSAPQTCTCPAGRTRARATTSWQLRRCTRPLEGEWMTSTGWKLSIRMAKSPTLM